MNHLPDPNLTEECLILTPPSDKLNVDNTFDRYNSTAEGGVGTLINEETIDSIDLFDKDRDEF